MITRYEIIARHEDGRAYLVAYTPRKGGTGLRVAVQERTEAIVKATGLAADTRFDYHPGPRVSWTGGGWTIGFTGRTELEAKRDGALPYVGTLNAA